MTLLRFAFLLYAQANSLADISKVNPPKYLANWITVTDSYFSTTIEVDRSSNTLLNIPTFFAEGAFIDMDLCAPGGQPFAEHSLGFGSSREYIEIFRANDNPRANGETTKFIRHDGRLKVFKNEEHGLLPKIRTLEFSGNSRKFCARVLGVIEPFKDRNVQVFVDELDVNDKQWAYFNKTRSHVEVKPLMFVNHQDGDFFAADSIAFGSRKLPEHEIRDYGVDLKIELLEDVKPRRKDLAYFLQLFFYGLDAGQTYDIAVNSSCFAETLTGKKVKVELVGDRLFKVSVPERQARVARATFAVEEDVFHATTQEEGAYDPEFDTSADFPPKRRTWPVTCHVRYDIIRNGISTIYYKKFTFKDEIKRTSPVSNSFFQMLKPPTRKRKEFSLDANHVSISAFLFEARKSTRKEVVFRTESRIVIPATLLPFKFKPESSKRVFAMLKIPQDDVQAEPSARARIRNSKHFRIVELKHLGKKSELLPYYYVDVPTGKPGLLHYFQALRSIDQFGYPFPKSDDFQMLIDLS